MLPRVSVRRLFLYILCCASLIFVIVNIRLRWQWPRVTPSAGVEGGVQTERTDEVLGGDAPAAPVPASGTSQPPGPAYWFLEDGYVRPKPAARTSTGTRDAKLFPFEDDGDRILEQLMYVPPDYTDSVPLKKILLYNGISSWAPTTTGRSVFVTNNCPVDRCTISTNRAEAQDSDAILFRDSFSPPRTPRPPDQVWILYFLECPYHTQRVVSYDTINWTATYRSDSDIVAPYEKWMYNDPNVKQMPQDRNYAHNKTKQVAWFVSNCNARNNRLAYAEELKNFIQVDIYGACGTYHCSRHQQDKCFEMLSREYKFYLAFENSNCQDYITEKFFVNGLNHTILPIVMGARPEDYERSAPLKSYIHVDEFASPKDLADYLHYLDQNDDAYNAYFRWKGTGQLINTYFWCRVCAMLHDGTVRKSYRDVNDWWRGRSFGVCTDGRWRKANATRIGT